MKIFIAYVFDMKFAYIAFGHLGWTSISYFCLFCGCTRSHVDEICKLTSSEEYLACHEDAKQMLLSEGDKTPAYEEYVRTKTFGINGTGVFASFIPIENVFLDTYHGKQNMSNSYIGALSVHVRASVKEDVDEDGLPDSLYVNFLKVMGSKVGLHVEIIDRIKKMSSPACIGHDCDAFRRSWITPSMSDSSAVRLEDELSKVRAIADSILTDTYAETVDLRQGVLPKFFEDEDLPTGSGYLHRYILSIYLFFGIYEELTSLVTCDKNLKRLKCLCSTFKQYANTSLFQTMNDLPGFTSYAHCFQSVYLLMAVKWYEKTGKGYGYFSMQACEHMNKVLKILFKTRTNGRLSSTAESYDAFAACLHINKMRYLLLEIRRRPSKGQRRKMLKSEVIEHQPE